MDELYRTYRISIRLLNGDWLARVTHAKGGRAPVSAGATQEEGEAACYERARDALDRYLAYLETPAPADPGDAADL